MVNFWWRQLAALTSREHKQKLHFTLMPWTYILCKLPLSSFFLMKRQSPKPNNAKYRKHICDIWVHTETIFLQSNYNLISFLRDIHVNVIVIQAYVWIIVKQYLHFLPQIHVKFQKKKKKKKTQKLALTVLMYACLLPSNEHLNTQ